MSIATAAGRARMSAGAGFNPITDVGWDLAYYPAGAAFAALGLSDGAAVTTYPAEVGATNLTGANGPTYRANIDGLGHPGLEFDGTNDVLSANIADVTSGGWRWFTVGRFRSTSGSYRLHGTRAATDASWGLLSGNWFTIWAVSASGGAADTNRHLFLTKGTTNAQTLEKYASVGGGAANLATASATGFPPLEKVSVGATGTGFGNAPYDELFTGVMFTDADPSNFAAFRDWAITEFGLS